MSEVNETVMDAAADDVQEVAPDAVAEETLEQVPEAGPEAEENESAPTGDEPGVSKARREAAGYRTKLRAAEAVNASLRDQLIGIHLKESHGVTLKALEAAGTDLSTLVGEDGTVNVEAVAEAAETARTTLGIPSTRFGGTADQGYRGPVPSTATWNGLIKTITRG